MDLNSLGLHPRVCVLCVFMYGVHVCLCVCVCVCVCVYACTGVGVHPVALASLTANVNPKWPVPT